MLNIGHINAQYSGGIDNIALWLRADKDVFSDNNTYLAGTTSAEDGDEVKSWADQSGERTNDATSELLTTPPTFIANAINFNPSIEFDGSDDGLDFADDYIYGTNDGLEVYIVLQADDNSSKQKPFVFDEGYMGGQGYGMWFGSDYCGCYSPQDYDGAYTTLSTGCASPSLVGVEYLFSNTQSLRSNGTILNTESFNLTSLSSDEVSTTVPRTKYKGPFTIGRLAKEYSLDSDGGRYFDGKVAEFILVDNAISDTDRSKIESYLAIKYGITLGSTETTVDYLASDETVVWTGNATYQNGIFGIGRDDLWEFEQKQSKSSNSDAIITIGLNEIASDNASNSHSFTDDLSFMLIGNDAGDLSEVTTELPDDILTRIDRKWKVETTNSIGEIVLEFDLSDLDLSGSSESDYYLLIDRDGDGDFSTGDIVRKAAYSLDSETLVFRYIDFQDGDEFTLGTSAKKIDGISYAPVMWMRADKGISASDGESVATWQGQTSGYNIASQEVSSKQPTFNASLHNFNPSITFDGGDYLPIEYNAGINAANITVFSVATLTQNNVDYRAVFSSRYSGSDDDESSGYNLFYHGLYFKFYTLYSDNWDNLVGNQITLNSPELATVNATVGSGAAYKRIRQEGEEVTDISTAYYERLTSSYKSFIGGYSSSSGDELYLFNGDISEVIIFSNILSDEETSKIESYLALKYGITQGSTNTTVDYLNSTGSTVWTGSDTYQNDIAGICRDDAFSFHQKQSISNSNDAIITMALGEVASDNNSNSNSFTDDISTIIWGNDDGILSEIDTDVPGDYIFNRIEREWRVQTTGTSASVVISVNLTDITISGTQTSDVRLLIDTDGDGDFTTGTITQIYASDSSSGDEYIFDDVTFNSGNVFTICTNANDAPEFTSTAVTSINEDAEYSYSITTDDAEDDDISITATTLPGWLSLTDNGDGTATLSGTPTNDNVGTNKVVLKVADDYDYSLQTFEIKVINTNDTPTISASDVEINENTTSVTTVSAADVDTGDSKTFSLSGDDASLFSISSSGVVTFKTAPNYEDASDSDKDNVYKLTITVTDESDATASVSITVTVNDVTEDATFSINTISDATIEENDDYTSVTPSTSGTYIGSLTYTISGGNDKALFSISSSTGVVSLTAKDFESPSDSDTNNDYEIQITATDSDGNTATQSWTVNVTDETEAATFSINTISDASVEENDDYTSVTPSTSGDYIGTLTYTISGGNDKALFSISSSTGVVSMTAKDFESPSDSDTNNDYEIQITATDSDGNTATQSWTVKVTDETEAATFSINTISDASVEENDDYTSVTPSTSGDYIGTLVYTISGGNDKALFSISSSTGVVSLTAKDFESPSDSDSNNDYEIQITATDSDGNTATASWTVSVTDETEAATFSINTISDATVEENDDYTSVTPSTSGTYIGTLTYTISGGNDKALFSISSSTGVVSMTAKDFESPSDSDTNNNYEIQITATDSDGNTATASWTVSVTDETETATFSINTISDASVEENDDYTSVTPSTSGTYIGSLTYTISGGNDKALFSISSSTGVVSLTAKDFESPSDSDTNNDYEIQITATDSDGNTATASWTVSVTDETETATFSINTISDASVEENDDYTSVTPSTSGDYIGTLVYTISGGNDKALFSISSSTGVVSMTAKDFESPSDSDSNNDYEIQITATDSDGNTATASWTVSVTDETETATFSINTISDASVEENDDYTSVTPSTSGTYIGSLTYTISGGNDKALFSISSSTGVVSLTAKDFESPSDSDTNNDYEIQITATDSDGNTATASWTVSVTDETEAATFSINTISDASVEENDDYTSVTPSTSGTYIGSLTYTISGGNDKALFSISSATGVVSMTAKDFESPSDSDTNNDYEIQITATDSDGNTATASWTVSVTDETEAATFSINTISDATVEENDDYTSVTPSTSGDYIGSLTYTISGGNDKALFSISSATGVVSLTAKDFESPSDSDTNNDYDIQITATDSDGNTATASWTVSVTDETETATFSINTISDASVEENDDYTSVTPSTSGTYIGSLTYTISGGNDKALFSISSSTGVVSMTAKDFESPSDSDTNNDYEVQITATDSDGNTATASWTVSVTDETEAATFSINTISDATVEENDNYTSETPSTSGDYIGTLTYTISGGNDKALFSISSATGVVSMTAKDFESPSDSDTNNDYEVQITATDSDGNTATDSWTVSVTDETEAATFSINTISDASVEENDDYTSVTPSTSGTYIGSLTYTISGGNDKALFSISSSTGVVSMTAKDFESPSDSDTNNDYNVEITATDSDGNTATASWTVSVTDETEAATFSINTISDASVEENDDYTSVTPSTTGTYIGSLTYTISGGNDKALFSISSSTGVVSMTAKDFESPSDSDTNNDYDIQITATDSDGNTATASWTVSVTDETEAATFSINTISDATVEENDDYTSVTPSTSGDYIGTLTYTISGGNDKALFSISSSTGVVSMTAKDFESPSDSDTNNDYEIQITATDSDGNTATQSWTVNVTDETETATFSINTISDATVEENDDYTSVTPSTSGTYIGSLTYTISGGNDKALFSISSATGVVSMTAKDFESPSDSDTNNDYEIQITATDSDGNTATASWTVSVTDETETATFSINTISDASVEENDDYTSVTPSTSGDYIGTLTYTISGGNDKALFSISSSTGVVSMTAKDFESPSDSDSNNDYEIQITATDSDGNTATQSWTVNVTDETEAATFSINTISDASVEENDDYTSVIPSTSGTYIGSLTYTISGGNDKALFSISSATGVVSMTAKDFESPSDSDSNNDYEIQITATDSDGNTATQSWTINITDETEAATFSINTISDASVEENDDYTSVTPSTSGDYIGTLTYTISGGNDKALFSISSSTGVVSMTAKDFESPSDSDSNNDYDIQITATDSDGNTTSQSWTVNVTDVSEVTSFNIDKISDELVNENTEYTSITPSITGSYIGTISYYISGGDDADLFTINSTSGVVSLPAQDYENPKDDNLDNDYKIEITAIDSDDNTASQSWTIIIADVNENHAPTIDDSDVYFDDYSSQEVCLIVYDSDGDDVDISNINYDSSKFEITISQDNCIEISLLSFINEEEEIEIQVCDSGTPQMCSTATITVHRNFEQAFEICNGISPNNDGVNDVFKVNGIELYPNNTVTIYDRWGNIIYKVKGYDNSNIVWSGEINTGLHIGSKVIQGTYFYLIKLGDGHKERTGFITVNYE